MISANGDMEIREILIGGRPARYFEFEYHRYSLAAWRDDRLRNPAAPSFAVTIDRHRDFVMPVVSELERFAACSAGAGFMRAVAEIPARANNDFIAYAFNENYCSDALVIAYEGYYEIEKKAMFPVNEAFSGRGGEPHRLLCLPSLTDAFARGCDLEKSPTYKYFYDGLGAARSVIVDIDLDYFTYQSPDDGVFVRREEDIAAAFASARPALSRLMERATTIAVARESVCCGGRENALKIREVLLEVLRAEHEVSFI